MWWGLCSYPDKQDQRSSHDKKNALVESAESCAPCLTFDLEHPPITPLLFLSAVTLNHWCTSWDWFMMKDPFKTTETHGLQNISYQPKRQTKNTKDDFFPSFFLNLFFTSFCIVLCKLLGMKFILELSLSCYHFSASSSLCLWPNCRSCNILSTRNSPSSRSSQKLAAIIIINRTASFSRNKNSLVCVNITRH